VSPAFICAARYDRNSGGTRPFAVVFRSAVRWSTVVAHGDAQGAARQVDHAQGEGRDEGARRAPPRRERITVKMARAWTAASCVLAVASTSLPTFAQQAAAVPTPARPAVAIAYTRGKGVTGGDWRDP
jgi:hypothetical protein